MGPINESVMLKKANVAYNETMFAVVLKAVGTLKDYALGVQVQGVVVKSGFGCDVVTAAAITSVYAKCKMLDELLPIFDVIPLKNLGSWSAIIAGRVQNDELEGGLDLFEEMQREGIGVKTHPIMHAVWELLSWICMQNVVICLMPPRFSIFFRTITCMDLKDVAICAISCF